MLLLCFLFCLLPSLSEPDGGSWGAPNLGLRSGAKRLKKKRKKKRGMSKESRRIAFSKHWIVACVCELVHSVRLTPVVIRWAPTGQAGTSKKKTITNSYSFTFGEKSILLYSLKSSIFFHFSLAWILSDSDVVWYNGAVMPFSECSNNQIV